MVSECCGTCKHCHYDGDEHMMVCENKESPCCGDLKTYTEQCDQYDMMDRYKKMLEAE